MMKFRYPQFVMPATLLFGSLMAITLIGNVGDLTISTLTFMAVMSILLDLQPTPSQRKTGKHIALYSLIAVFLSAVFFVLTGIFGINSTIRTTPLLLLIAGFVFHSGVGKLLQYWKPLLLLFVLALPDGTLLKPVIYPILKLFAWDQLAYATAHFTTMMTNFIGVPAVLEDLDINMPNAIVTVSSGCDGYRILDFMVRLSIILVVTFYVERIRWIPVLFTGLLLAFIINGFRITLLTYLANAENFTAFDFWHIGSGAKVFYLSTIILFCIFGYFQISQPDEKQKLGAGRVAVSKAT